MASESGMLRHRAVSNEANSRSKVDVKVNGGTTEKPSRLVNFDDLPAWAKESPFVRRGYRRPGPGPGEGRSEIHDHGSVHKCLQSIFAYWHNETINIHTHLWGALTVLTLVLLHVTGALHHVLPSAGVPTLPGMSIDPESDPARLADLTTLRNTSDVKLPLAQLLRTVHPTQEMVSRPPSLTDKLAFTSFYLGAFTMLGCSTTFHTLTAHSRRVSKLSNRLDYIGIVFMIVGSFLPALHYGFHCHPYLKILYGTGVTILGSISMYCVAQERYTTAEYRTLRTSIFLALGLSAVLPIAHMVFMYGINTVAHLLGMYHVAISGALYVVGALTYLLRFPERLYPGKFDYVGASHQLFHLAILLAAAAHYVALRRGFAFWHTVEVGLGDPVDHISDQAKVQAVCQTLERWRRM